MRFIKRRIIITILIYFASVIAGVSIILFLVYSEHRETVRSMADNFTDQYTELGSFDDIDLHAFGLLVYDSDGKCILSRTFTSMVKGYNIETDAQFEELYSPAIKRFVSPVLSQQKKDGIIYLPKGNIFASYSGSYVSDSSGDHFALFAIRNITNVTYAIIFFVSVYSVGFVIVSIAVNSIYIRKQKYYEMQNVYIANITHDLKSPITSIRALAETMNLEIPDDPEKYHKYIRFIISESINLEHTVNDILELSSFQNNEKLFIKSTVNAVSMFEPVLEKYRILCYDMMIGFNVSGNSSTLRPVRTNPDSMARVLDILLDNAVKFTDPENGMISVDFSNESNHLLVKVSDNGIGMDRETASLIFERFYMSDKSHNSNGSGLGLAIAKEIIDGLKETIHVKSEPGAGAEFTFTIHYS